MADKITYIQKMQKHGISKMALSLDILRCWRTTIWWVGQLLFLKLSCFREWVEKSKQGQNKGLCLCSPFRHNIWNICLGKDGVDSAVVEVKSWEENGEEEENTMEKVAKIPQSISVLSKTDK